ncbi:hypothetical protein OKW21_001206 [Catalinimonas alkaloidigena]|uniref:DUF3667 domain-containing protein n=1 Tax=Catalinimonas alkaloidigena TaxID=1075417 RepID=UPI002406CEDE|nr:DUF3667 domain-containing protein [Catalinimonas alkaloidigena]MDF9795943.1 hypothetical protein [Catalinimonas alkaloidigena]
MRIRRKTKDCLNCGLSLNEIYHYCPRCGQENNDQNVSFGTLVKEFFINYFSFDTNFARSIKPFVIAPGFLTLRFNEGKRVSYVHPLRLYIIISVVFFFLSTLWLTDNIVPEESSKDTNVALLQDSLSNPLDSVVINQWEIMGSILEDETLSDYEALDSLRSFGEINVRLDSYFGSLAFRQLRKVVRQDFEVFVAYVMQNAPIMMFMLLPLFAFILKLLYFRHKHLYMNHLIHGIHLHSFAFFLTSVLLLINLLVDVGGIMSGVWVYLALQALITIYIFISFQKVYQQGGLKTLVKIFILGNIYAFVLLVFGLSETFISFLIF